MFYSSKDAVIRVWDRITLDLHRTLRGHEGPVNAVGLQSGKVVRVVFTYPLPTSKNVSDWFWYR